MSKKKQAVLKTKRIKSPLLTEASRTLLANIRFAELDEDIKTLVVTSTMADEGKTTVVLSLATAIAFSGKSVLLIDADMRRRNLAQLLDVHPRYGLYAAVSGAALLDDIIVPTSIPQLFFMDCEPDIPSPPDILSSRRFSLMLESLSDAFDYILFDAPPASVFIDAAILGSLVDGTLFVARQGQAKRTMALKSVQQLRQANARILGCVMTFTTNEESDYYYHYYTQDGNRAPVEDASSSSGSSLRRKSESSREVTREVSRETSREAPREISREVPRDVPREAPQEDPREASENIAQGITQDIIQEEDTLSDESMADIFSRGTPAHRR